MPVTISHAATSPTAIAAIVTWLGVTASDRRARMRVIRIEIAS